ncbi:MAG TPA: penicillin-binding transpeptidase domain-containing protein, partial [Actinomycetota bacterium]|nr:penicillin-binding transpeptidase domain-containing protein [Actinomycetota bacterium]
RVSRLGWEQASDRPMAWRAPWRHLDPTVVLAAIALSALGLLAIYSSTFAGFPLHRFPVAGKTGTADLPPQAPFAWFASYAPVGDPKFVVVVMVEQGGHGGESAAPVARAIYQKLFGLPVAPVAGGADRSG